MSSILGFVGLGGWGVGLGRQKLKPVLPPPPLMGYLVASLGQHFTVGERLDQILTSYSCVYTFPFRRLDQFFRADADISCQFEGFVFSLVDSEWGSNSRSRIVAGFSCVMSSVSLGAEWCTSM